MGGYSPQRALAARQHLFQVPLQVLLQGAFQSPLRRVFRSRSTTENLIVLPQYLDVAVSAMTTDGWARSGVRWRSTAVTSAARSSRF